MKTILSLLKTTLGIRMSTFWRIGIVAVAIGSSRPTLAATRTFTGAGAPYDPPGIPGQWGNPLNWDSGVPRNGDTLMFPANLARTSINDLPLSLEQIIITGTGSGWVLVSLVPITITGGITDNHMGGGGNTIVMQIINNKTSSPLFTVHVQNDQNYLRLDSLILGSGGLIKTGAGKLVLSGASANTYAGLTTVVEGWLTLDKTAGPAVPHGLTLGDGGAAYDYVQYNRSDQIDGDVTIKSSGKLRLYTDRLDRFTDTIGKLTMMGGGIDTGGGTLTLGGNVQASFAQATITGNLNLGASGRTFDIATPNMGGNLLISANIGGGPSAPDVALLVTGGGNLTLSGNNTFGGEIVVDWGTLTALSNTALGTTDGATTVKRRGSLSLNGVDIGTERLIMQSESVAGLEVTGAPCTFAGNIELQSTTSPTGTGIRTHTNLTLTGAISGTRGFSKTGAGDLVFAGPSANTYSGATYVYEGTLVLKRNASSSPWSPRISVPSDLVVGEEGGFYGAASVRLDYLRQIAPAAKVTLSPWGLLDLNGYSQEIGPLGMNGGVITNTGSAVLTLGGTVSTRSFAIGPYVTPNIYGVVSLGGANRVVSVGDGPQWEDLTLWGEVREGGIVKQGPGMMNLRSRGTYAGLTSVNEGILQIMSFDSLGTTGDGTAVASGATLIAVQGPTACLEPLTLSGPGTGYGSLLLWNGSGWGGAIRLNGDAVFNCAPDGTTATINSPVSGPGGFTKIGPGTLLLSGTTANSYAGVTRVHEGNLTLSKATLTLPASPRVAVPGALVVGDGAGLDKVRFGFRDQIASWALVTLTPSGLLDLNGFSQPAIGALTMTGGVITNTSTGLLTLGGVVTATSVANGPAYPSPTIYGPVSLNGAERILIVDDGPQYHDLALRGEVQSGGITKEGPGLLVLGASNSYAGPTWVNTGVLVTENNHSLGGPNNGTSVNGGARLVVGWEVNTPEPLILSGSVGAKGILDLWDKANCLGSVTLANEAEILCALAAATSAISGPIVGPAGFTKIGLGSLTLNGSAANAYSGITRVNEGTLILNKSVQSAAVPGDLFVGDGIGGASADVVRLMSSQQIGPNAAVVVKESGLLEWGVGGLSQVVGTIAGSGRVNLRDGSLTIGGNHQSAAFVGAISGAGGSLHKLGAGTLSLSGSNTYSGGTFVHGGTLGVSGMQSAGPMTVYGEGYLGGLGSVGQTLIEGSLFYGDLAFGVLQGGRNLLASSNLAFTASADFNVQLKGPAPGREHDQLVVRGSSDLGNARLYVLPLFETPARLGDSFRIIDNDGSDRITGAFAGLPNGTNFTVRGYRFRINYDGGTGNDVVLTLTGLPLSQASAEVTAGNGNHTIDPDECNLLSIVLIHDTATTLFADAVLSSTTPHVVVTQPFSEYHFTNHDGLARNLTPFQITTDPQFACGTEIELQLKANVVFFDTFWRGQFVVPLVVHSGHPAVSPRRYDQTVSANIPDIGTIESTNVVAGFTGPLAQVAVSVYLTHVYAGDLTLSLFSPDGTTVLLSANNGGAGQNYGTGCSPDTNRTTFIDSFGNPITGGTAPFVGAWSPQGTLTTFVGKPASAVNGLWRLRVSDRNGGSLGTLRCWSLFLYPAACTPGGGACDTCAPAIAGTMNHSPQYFGRISLDKVMAGCGTTKSVPSIEPDLFHYKEHAFTNNGATDSCVTVQLQSSADLMAVAYRSMFSPEAITQNYLGDAGYSTAELGGITSFSCAVPAGSRFVVMVNKIKSAADPTPVNYTLTVSGLPCQTPALDIASAGAPNSFQVGWPTWAAGYQLESSPSLAPPAWSLVSAEPITSNGRYRVTNSTGLQPARYYRLRK